MNAGPALTRYAPAIRINPAAVESINRLARPRGDFSATVEGLSLRLVPAGLGVNGVSPLAEGMVVVMSVDAEEHLFLRVPIAIIERLVRAVQADLNTLPEGPAGIFLLELALAPFLDAAEGLTGKKLRIESVEDIEAPSDAIVTFFEGALDGADFVAALALPSQVGGAAQAVTALLDRLPGRSVRLPDLSLPLTWVAGFTQLTVGQLSALSLGDVVLPELWHPRWRELRVVLSTTHVAMALRDANRARLKTALRPIPARSPAYGRKDMRQDATTEAAAPARDETNIDAVGLTLNFELGQRWITLAELKQIGPGYVFDLDLSPDEPVDLVVNESRIGRGEIVSIGERLGVRVVRLFGQSGSARSE